MKKALFIYNPVAGRKQIHRHLEKIINILGEEFHLVIRETKMAGDGAEIVKNNYTKKFDAIICCGGDGTLNEVINGVISCGLSVPIGYIPCGSTNDFARSMNIPTNPTASANNILKDNVSSIDIGEFNGSRHFSYIASFGAFTEASYNTPQREKNALGHFAYVVRGTEDFFALKNSPVYNAEISLSDGRSIKGEYFFGAVCNSTSVGGLLRLPKSSVDLRDGIFECIFIKKPQTSKEWFALLDDILRRRIDQNPLVEMYKTSEIKVDIAGKVNWTLDGEKEQTLGPIEIKNKKHAIRILG